MMILSLSHERLGNHFDKGPASRILGNYRGTITALSNF